MSYNFISCHIIQHIISYCCTINEKKIKLLYKISKDKNKPKFNLIHVISGK